LQQEFIFGSICPVFGRFGFDFGKSLGFFLLFADGKGRRGCNAHIVRLAEYQAVKKIDPRGVEIRKLLILRQTNNVCVAPPLLLLAAHLLLGTPSFAACCLPLGT